MITLDVTALILVVLAAALTGALVAVMPAWEHLRGGRHLPVWAFLRRRGTTLERLTALEAELRCETCNAKLRCKQLLAEGADMPVADCPNLKVLRGS